MDYYADNGYRFAQLFHDRDLPGFAKQGSLETPETLSALPNEAFADPARRQFPIHEPGNIYVSAAYAYSQKNAEVIPGIEKAAELFGIASDLAELKNHIEARLAGEENQKVANLTTPKEFEFEFDRNTKLAGAGQEAFEEAQRFFVEHADLLSVQERFHKAAELHKVAQDNGFEISPEVERFYGGSWRCSGSKLNEECFKRATLVVDSKDKERVIKLAQPFLEHGASYTIETYLKVAEALETFDREFHLAKFYGERLNAPHQAVFNTSSKEAAELTGGHLTVGDRVYSRQRWEGGNFGMLHDAIETAVGRTKAAELLPDGKPDHGKFASLSAVEASLINRYLSALP